MTRRMVSALLAFMLLVQGAAFPHCHPETGDGELAGHAQRAHLHLRLFGWFTTHHDDEHVQPIQHWHHNEVIVDDDHDDIALAGVGQAEPMSDDDHDADAVYVHGVHLALRSPRAIAGGSLASWVMPPMLEMPFLNQVGAPDSLPLPFVGHTSRPIYLITLALLI
jgi:hypothetical protein